MKRYAEIVDLDAACRNIEIAILLKFAKFWKPLAGILYQ